MQNSTASIDLSTIVTIILAFSSFLSPIFVAIINNWHHSKIRKKELEHDARVRQMDLHQQAVTSQLSIYYADKKAAFSNFLQAAGSYSMVQGSAHDYSKMQTAIQNALLFCSPHNQTLLLDFLRYSEGYFDNTYSKQERSEYGKKLANLTLSLNQELEATKPVLEND